MKIRMKLRQQRTYDMININVIIFKQFHGSHEVVLEFFKRKSLMLGRS